MRFTCLVLVWLMASPVLAQQAEAPDSSGERVALELAGGLLGAGLSVIAPVYIAMDNIEQRDAEDRHCAMELSDCGVWSLDIGPFVGPALLYGLLAPLTTAAGVAIAGDAAGGSSSYGAALAGAALGAVPAAVLTLAAAYRSDGDAYAALVGAGTVLPALLSMLIYEVHHDADARRKRTKAFTFQPFATLSGNDRRGVLLGAAGTF